jgi:hypothetical protein
MPFLWNSFGVNETLESFTSGGGVLLSLSNCRSVMLSYHVYNIFRNQINEPHEDLVLLESLRFVLKVGTFHYTGKLFPRKNKGLKMGCFPHF